MHVYVYGKKIPFVNAGKSKPSQNLRVEYTNTRNR